MATIDELLTQNKLISIQVPLGPKEMPNRQIVIGHELYKSLETLKNKSKGRKGDPSDFEKIMLIFRRYIRGDNFDAQRELRILEPVGNYVWEFKPSGIRIFGYAYRKGIFIGSQFAEKQRLTFRKLEDKKRYDPYIKKTLRFREQLNLDPPACIESEDINDIL